MIKINKKFLFLILALFLVLALFFNVSNFIGFFNNALGNIYFDKGNYKDAINYHKKVENSTNNNTIKYNLGGDYYKLGDYNKAKEYYKRSKIGTGEKADLDINYNLGNTFYRLGDKEANVENKISLWEESLYNYKKVLDEKEDKKVKENYDFVMEKLKKLKEKQNEDNNAQSQNNEEKSNNSQDKTEEDKEGEKKEGENGSEENKSGKSSEYDVKENSEIKELSEEEKKELEVYNEQLKQEQKENSDLFGKKNQGNNEDIFEMLRQDPIFGNFENFDDSILNENEKDW